jgi:hypothetical protein
VAGDKGGVMAEGISVDFAHLCVKTPMTQQFASTAVLSILQTCFDLAEWELPTLSGSIFTVSQLGIRWRDVIEQQGYDI